MKYSKILLVAVIGVLAVTLPSGCASLNRRVPSKAITNPSGDVFYVTRRASIPKDVTYRPVTDGQISAQGVSAEVIGAIANAGAQIVEGYFKTKENIVVVDTEILAIGSNISSKTISEAFKAIQLPMDAQKDQ